MMHGREKHSDEGVDLHPTHAFVLSFIRPWTLVLTLATCQLAQLFGCCPEPHKVQLSTMLERGNNLSVSTCHEACTKASPNEKH